jgi:membrane protein YqaA with SNARE-associated domain
MSFLGDIFLSFTALGTVGMLVGLFWVVFFDAIVVPIGPELLAIAMYTENVSLGWAALIVVAVALGQVSGTSVLYLIGRHPRVIPHYVKHAMDKYRSSLLIKDERIVFVNCFVPILPFLGAFIAIAGWDWKKSFSYVAIGGAIKYSFYLAMSGTFHYLFEKGIAQKVSLLVVLALLVTSAVYGLTRRRKMEKADRMAAADSESGKDK